MEAEAPHIAGAVQHAYDDGLGSGDAEIDIVVAVHNEAEAGAEVVARGAAVAQPGCALQVAVDAGNIALGGCRVPDRFQASIDGVEVTSRARREDQLLRWNRAPPPER